jgi:hypothetical protein
VKLRDISRSKWIPETRWGDPRPFLMLLALLAVPFGLGLQIMNSAWAHGRDVISFASAARLIGGAALALAPIVLLILLILNLLRHARNDTATGSPDALPRHGWTPDSRRWEGGRSRQHRTVRLWQRDP